MMTDSSFFLAVVIFGVVSFGSYGDVDALHLPRRLSRETAVSDLPRLFETEEGIQELYEEYASIKAGQRRPWTIAQLPENIKKNRYFEDNLLPFDHSRVILKKLHGDPHSDYINANYIDGINSEREYVATQGPLQNTIEDFWRMMWQLNSTKIIMLASLVEHNKTKVDKYWPETSELYGDIKVITLMEYPIEELQHVIRTFSVRKSGIAQPRIVRQFHFTGWPDLGVPTNRLMVTSLLHQARLFDPDNKAPIVVHCSAGIGRTGTVILTDSMIQKGKADGVVDFPKRLDHMRTLRPDVVEKKEQYLFAHRAVSEVINDPEMAEKLKGVDDVYYTVMDRELDLKELATPKDVRHTLQRMSWQNNVMNLLIDDLYAKTAAITKLEPADGA